MDNTTPDLRFDNLNEIEQQLFKMINLELSTNVDQMVTDAERKYCAARDKVTLQDYVVKEVLKKCQDVEKLLANKAFLKHVPGAQYKMARRWGKLTEEQWALLKNKAKSLLLVTIM
jgi:hypothetical protein